MWLCCINKVKKEKEMGIETAAEVCDDGCVIVESKKKETERERVKIDYLKWEGSKKSQM